MNAPNLPVYLDCQATTPLDPRVAKVMAQTIAIFGNPHSRQHAYGNAAAEAVEKARVQVASLIGAYPRNVVFTSGATESCNLALRGAARVASATRNRVITLATEHPAVLETVKDLGDTGFTVEILPVADDGLVDLNLLAESIDESTLIVSVMAVNNEIGVIQPLREIAAICRQHGALFHTDATQAPGRISVDVEALRADLLTISSHKFYGPKGVGSLFIAEDGILAPIIAGGGQERGFRSGTIPTLLVAGFGEAAEIAASEWDTDAERMTRLTGTLKKGLEEIASNVRFFGSLNSRAPGSLSFGFPGLSGDKVVAMVAPKIAISTGSACASHSASVSHVLSALGCSHAEAATGVRVGLGRFTNDADIETAIAAFSAATS